MLTRLAAPAVIALALACAMTGGLPAQDARANATAVAIIACENLAPYLDGDPADATAPADEQAACLDPIPPTGPLSIASLELAAGDGDGVLTWTELNPIDFLDHNRIDETCTYEAVITLATKPAPGCTLLVFVFVDDESFTTMDVTAGLVTLESGGIGDFQCGTDGTGLGQDSDCSDAVNLDGDGVVVFHILNESSENGETEEARGTQEAVEQSVSIQMSSDTRYDPAALDDPDDDGIDTTIDNCWLAANPDQLNTDSDPFVTPGIALADITAPNGDSLGDACDPDDDNDGLDDFFETGRACTGNPISPTKIDTDGDRVADGAECSLSSNPASPDSRPLPFRLQPDPDRDGLSTDFEEDKLHTDPLDPDSDDDGVKDGVEFKGYNTDPLVPDSDSDGCPDGQEIASVDDDFIVTEADRALVAQSYGATDRPNMDMNKDGRVNSGDLLFVALSLTSAPCID